MSDDLIANQITSENTVTDYLSEAYRDYFADLNSKILDHVNPAALKYITRSIPAEILKDMVLIRSSKLESLNSIPKSSGILNFSRFNNCIRINKFFEKTNEVLKTGDYYVACFESMVTRKQKLFGLYGKIIGWPLHYLDFAFNRVLPKLKLTKGIYFKVTNGNNRAVSITEGLGRLISCGFEVLDYRTIDDRTYVITKKAGNPTYDMEPTYFLICKLHRVGRGGQLIDVLKLRTMYPYSEYVQSFVFQQNDLQEGGKLRDDYRITSWGKFFRRYWIDELPMLINWVRGEMKFFGVRPLSLQYFSLYPDDMQKLRTSVVPGLVPPYYADMPKSLDEVIESERCYILSYIGAPIRTDVRYFFKALYNILFKKARSK
jgi:lipopolysaccharide/colanic/teichoic acid biosynthesis glycosyltransferase